MKICEVIIWALFAVGVFRLGKAVAFGGAWPWERYSGPGEFIAVALVAVVLAWGLLRCAKS